MHEEVLDKLRHLILETYLNELLKCHLFAGGLLVVMVAAVVLGTLFLLPLHLADRVRVGENVDVRAKVLVYCLSILLCFRCSINRI